MTENKRFVFDPSISHFTDTKTEKEYCEYNLDKVVDLLNSLSEELYIAENEIARLELIKDKLKKENEMLKITIGRNEAYINQLTNKEKWTN